MLMTRNEPDLVAYDLIVDTFTVYVFLVFIVPVVPVQVKVLAPLMGGFVTVLLTQVECLAESYLMHLQYLLLELQ